MHPGCSAADLERRSWFRMKSSSSGEIASSSPCPMMTRIVAARSARSACTTSTPPRPRGVLPPLAWAAGGFGFGGGDGGGDGGGAESSDGGGGDGGGVGGLSVWCTPAPSSSVDAVLQGEWRYVFASERLDTVRRGLLEAWRPRGLVDFFTPLVHTYYS